MRQGILWMPLAVILAGCGASESDDQARLLAWRQVTIEQALRCDEPLFSMMEALERGDVVSASRAARQTMTICREATVELGEFGSLPGVGAEGNSSASHPCSMDTSATAEAAETVMLLLEGDTRPSVRATIAEALNERANNMAKCAVDSEARAASLGV